MGYFGVVVVIVVRVERRNVEGFIVILWRDSRFGVEDVLILVRVRILWCVKSVWD